MSKLNFMGIGPKIGMFAFPWLALTIYLSLRYTDTFRYVDSNSSLVFYLGLVFLAIGLIFYLSTIPALLRGLKQTKLVTSGTYYLCCNPLYASIMLFILPAISLMMNSWLVLTTSIVAFIAFKSFIGKEYSEMETFFGDAFTEYRSKTPELFPFPFKKWFK